MKPLPPGLVEASAWWNLVFSGRVGLANGHITGTGIAPLSFSPSPLALGGVPVGGAGGSPVTVTVKNLTHKSITLNALSFGHNVAPTGQSEFHVDPTSTCSVGFSLASSASCDYALSFGTPTLGAAFGATIQLGSSAGFATLAFTGTGIR